MSMKGEVLSLYRRIFRTARQWKAISANDQDSSLEQSYIKKEARYLFHKNKNVESEEEIRMHLKEAEARLELAIHYRIPYPRPMNLPQTLLPTTGKKLKKGQRRMLEQSKPIYLKSQDVT